MRTKMASNSFTNLSVQKNFTALSMRRSPAESLGSDRKKVDGQNGKNRELLLYMGMRWRTLASGEVPEPENWFRSRRHLTLMVHGDARGPARRNAVFLFVVGVTFQVLDRLKITA